MRTVEEVIVAPLESYTPLQGWHVIRTHAKQELRAEQNLRAGRIEVFLPRMAVRRTRRDHRYSEVVPLFTQYLFARFDPETRLHDVTFTRGVQAPLRIGAELAIVDDEVIEFLRARVREDGLIHVGTALQPGERVMIEDGPFAALVGIVERVLSERERVLVLLSTVRTPLRLDLEIASVRRLSPAHA
jgi:transcription elongation factor/antiterminator RfaH